MKRFERAGEIDRDQHQVQRIHPKHVTGAIAARQQISGVERVVRYRGQREPERLPALAQRNRENDEQANVHHRDRRKIVAAHQSLCEHPSS